jgi:outer membrane receptor protein involved in Fe transport
MDPSAGSGRPLGSQSRKESLPAPRHQRLRRLRGWRRCSAGADRRFIANEDNVTFGGKFSRAVAGGHTLVTGWDAAHGWRTETRLEHVQPGDTVAATGEEVYNARLDRMALFAQDDCSITPAFSVSAGLRWETLRTRTEGNVLDEVRQQTHVLSPLVQALYKLSDSQQLRAGQIPACAGTTS